jgi:hypothetical protein
MRMDRQGSVGLRWKVESQTPRRQLTTGGGLLTESAGVDVGPRRGTVGWADALQHRPALAERPVEPPIEPPVERGVAAGFLPSSAGAVIARRRRPGAPRPVISRASRRLRRAWPTAPGAGLNLFEDVASECLGGVVETFFDVGQLVFQQAQGRGGGVIVTQP